MNEVTNCLKRDWTVMPFMGLTLLGFAAGVLDFVYLQNFSFQIFAVPGLILLILGGLVRMKARLQLKKKAGFGSLTGTAQLKIVKKHQLVKDGLYKHVRHPLYLGEILRKKGWQIKE